MSHEFFVKYKDKMVDDYFKVNAVGPSGCGGVHRIPISWGDPRRRLSSFQASKTLVDSIARMPPKQQQKQTKFNDPFLGFLPQEWVPGTFPQQISNKYPVAAWAAWVEYTVSAYNLYISSYSI